jgi:general secretion pathway protein J
MPLRPQRNQGLTLIEVLVALSIMAVLALLSWRVIDGMAKTQTIARDHSDHWLNWQTTMAQWQTDLDAMADAGTVGPLDFDGRVLRLTRRDSANDARPEMRVVAWTVQTAPSGTTPHLMRWTSRPFHDQTELQNAWNAALAWGQNTSTATAGQALPLVAVQSWSLFYHRGGSWTNPLSDAGPDNTPNPQRRRAPDGIRLTLTLPDTGLSTGTLSKDWVNPTVGGDKTQ